MALSVCLLLRVEPVRSGGWTGCQRAEVTARFSDRPNLCPGSELHHVVSATTGTNAAVGAAADVLAIDTSSSRPCCRTMGDGAESLRDQGRGSTGGSPARRLRSPSCPTMLRSPRQRHCAARSSPLKVANGGVETNRRLVSLLHSVNVQLALTLRPAFLGLSPIHANSPRIDTESTRSEAAG